jgi:hypothetical protein
MAEECTTSDFASQDKFSKNSQLQSLSAQQAAEPLWDDTFWGL